MPVTRAKPSVIQLPGGVKLKATLVLVTERDDDGSPRLFRLIHDDEKVNVAQGDDFVVVYMPDDVRDRRN